MKKKVGLFLLAALCVALAVTAIACNNGTLQSIALKEGTEFAPVIEGTEPDFTDKTFVATYSDKTTREIEITGDMISGFDNTKLGEQKVTLTYTEGEASASTEITLKVVAKEAASLNIAAEPAAKDYVAGEKFNAYGMRVEVVYNNGEREEITDYTLSPLSLTTSVTEVEISYAGKKVTTPVTVTEPTATAATSAELTAALAAADDGDAIAVQGTIGSSDRDSGYTIYTVRKGVKIVGTGEEMPTVYGSFFVDSDNVLIRGLRIKNRGWVTEDEHTAHRNAITAVTNKIAVEHNEMVAPSPESVDTSALISNGLILYAGTDEDSAIYIRNNAFRGFGNDNEEWSSVAVDVVAGANFPFNAHNKADSEKSVRVSVNAREIIDSSDFSGYADNYIYSDYSDGGYNVYLYAYVKDIAGLENALAYAHPDGITIELAPGTYTLSEAVNADNVNLVGLGNAPVIISGELNLGEHSSTRNITLSK